MTDVSAGDGEGCCVALMSGCRFSSGVAAGTESGCSCEGIAAGDEEETDEEMEAGWRDGACPSVERTVDSVSDFGCPTASAGEFCRPGTLLSEEEFCAVCCVGGVWGTETAACPEALGGGVADEVCASS